jgi:PAS domain S-box-containing protein
MTDRSSSDEVERRTRALVRPDPEIEALSSDQIGELIQDLRTHQIELEIQNEELRVAQRALAEARDRFVHLYDFGPVGYVTLSERGLILEANLTLARMLGEERPALIGKSIVQWAMTSEHADAIWLHCQKLGRMVESGSCEVMLRDGGDGFWAKLESERVEDPDDGEVRIRSAVLDVTDQRAAEEERRRLEQEIFRIQKIESLVAVAGGVAHDFNNLLTVILGHAELVLSEAPHDSTTRESARGIEQASRFAADLCRQLLEYAGGGFSRIELLDLSTLVRGMLRLLQASISKDATLELRLADELPAIEGDATKVRQVVMNLVANAAEAIGGRGGTIRVSTERVADGRAFLATRTSNAGEGPAGVCVLLEVSDTGCGMDAATQTRIYDPFFSTKFTGRGLGLSSVLGIVRTHRGVISVRSDVGEGASFWVLFPTVDRSALATTSPTTTEVLAEPAAMSLVGGTVLVVDDEPLVRHLTERVLSAAGCEVLTAGSGREALAIYQEHGAKIAVVLLDLTMPDLGGHETLLALRGIRPGVRVVLMSGYGEREVLDGLEEAELPTSFLQKPYTGAQLIEILRRAAPEGTFRSP